VQIATGALLCADITSTQLSNPLRAQRPDPELGELGALV
jgi:hypothetical protein